MAKSDSRLKEMAAKRAKKQAQMASPGAVSNYARKSQYLNAHGGRGTETKESYITLINSTRRKLQDVINEANKTIA